MTDEVDWAAWTVIMLKPECVTRNLVAPVLDVISASLTIVDCRTLVVTAAQILSHYSDLLTPPMLAYFTWVDVEADLRRHYVGHRIGISLAYGAHAAPRLRDLLGHYDPAHAAPTSIRGRFGQDSATRARAEHRLIDNLIHSSDDPDGAQHEFRIWYGPENRHLLTPPLPPSNGETP